jgi:hypothetical protein
MTRQTTLALCVVLLASAGCATNYRNDFDPAADFSKYKTYALAGGEDLGKTGLLNNSLVRQRIETLVGRQLQNRGLREVSLDQNPDLAVRYWVGVEQKQEVTRVPSPYYAYGSPSRYGHYWSGPWESMYDDVVVTNYREGTLIVDLIDARTKNLVWRTYLVRALSDDPEKNLKGADKDLTKAFAGFPPTSEEKEKKKEAR